MVGNQELVEYLQGIGVLKTPEIIDAFLKIDRIDFVPKQYKDLAYADHPLDIGFGQTISQPYTIAFMLELLKPKSGQNILEIGTGSGYVVALLAKVAGERGDVIGTERIGDLVELSKNNLEKYRLRNTQIVQAQKDFGVPGKKFDRILVSAAADNLPQELLGQLDENGKLVIPVGSSIFLFERMSKGKIGSKEYPGFVFVPLIK
ncbi:MAG: protein-L-isoaspartate O-methyltransferase [Candidatus Liptonbacteria bacterium]